MPLIKLEITIYSPHFDEKLKWNTLQLKTEINDCGKKINRSNLLAKNNFNSPRSAHFFVHFCTTLYGGR